MSTHIAHYVPESCEKDVEVVGVVEVVEVVVVVLVEVRVVLVCGLWVCRRVWESDSLHAEQNVLSYWLSWLYDTPNTKNARKKTKRNLRKFYENLRKFAKITKFAGTPTQNVRLIEAQKRTIYGYEILRKLRNVQGKMTVQREMHIIKKRN